MNNQIQIHTLSQQSPLHYTPYTILYHTIVCEFCGGGVCKLGWECIETKSQFNGHNSVVAALRLPCCLRHKIKFSDMKARHETKPNESNETTSEQVNKSKHTGLCVHTTFPAPKSGAVEGRNGI